MPTTVQLNNLSRLEITTTNINYYDEIEKNLVDSAYNDSLKEHIQQSRAEHQHTLSTREKKKSNLFVDFNGVLSYKHFWHSLAESHPEVNKDINSYLFGEHKELVQEWMI
ncbi:MAG: hypothetical protein H6765_00145 [Candidatus Peribacteria bacterium]|nr:MAG: hypothetical protein H6765_00145 [Candidatus Peribacteria bacterium]